MKKKLTLIVVAFVVILSTCSKKPYEKLPDGIILYPSDGQVKQVKVKVLGKNMVEVTATPADTLSGAKSLMVLPQAEFSEWNLDEDSDNAIISTNDLRVEVSLRTGSVIFKDPSGKILLQEQKGGGKTFVEQKTGEQRTYRIKQVFDSPDDEAFYGLGGHQNGQMNYKGEDVEMVQHNIVDVVPFLYSNKNYGLLWENYAISYFGDSRPYQQLSSLKLFDRNGNPGGISADYYVQEKVVRSATEDKINYEFLETPEVDSFPKDVAQNGKVVWEGSFTSDVEGDHKFLVYASGYFKIWVDGQLIMDKWRQNWNPWTNKFKVNIRKEEKHAIRIEWICEGGFLAVKHLDPLPENEQSNLSLSSEIADEIKYYFIKGNNADDVIRGYRTLTGKAPIMPLWAMGFWQSRERYRSQREIIEVVNEYRKRKIPLDNIVLDWQYWEDPKWGSHEFDRKRFPDPAAMVQTLHDSHARLMISVWPKFNKGTDHFEEMNKKGFLFTRNIEKRRKDWVGIGYESTFYDPFNPEAGKLFWKQIDTKLNSIGIDAWWLDATEPDIYSNLSLEERKLNMSPTALGPGEKFFNAYSLLNSRSVYEGLRKSSPERRHFILTRSAYGGQQRYGAATWSGDIVSRWSDFKDQISTGVNFSLSGIPYWTMDIGGFAVERKYYNATGEVLNEWRELNARWFQFAAFVPVFRSHGQYPFREIYNIAPEGHVVYETMVYYDKLRYKLLPYIYTLAAKSYFDDYTMMRGLVMDFPADENVTDIADQYMFGPSLLVNPVTEYQARSREVYLPSSHGWYDLQSGNYFPGGQRINAAAPLERMPVFVREGSIIPAGPDMQYSNEKPADPLTLYIYTGRDADFILYEDEGINYNYEQGLYSKIPFRYDDKAGVLTIGARQGSFGNMLQQRTFEIVWVKRDKPVGMGPVARPDQVVRYTGEQIIIPMKQ